MSCFPCINPRRKDVRNYDDAVGSAESSVSGRGKENGGSNENGRRNGSLSGKGKESCSSKENVACSFTFRELATATRNFKEVNLIGEGGFGRVYKGRLESGEIVAIKQLNLSGLQGNQEFIVEVLMLSLLHHPNLVTLIGYCTDGDQRLLVYEYLSMGSLEDHLFDVESDKEPLGWNTRNEDCYFGLAKLGPVGENTHVSTRVMGTYGYCAPEYAMSGKLTLKSDIYSFGVVLLELITGRKVIDNTKKPGEQNLVVWSRPFLKDRRKFVQLVDPLLQGRFPVRCLHHAVAITAMCLQEQANFRPLIGDIVVALEYLASQTNSSESHRGGPRANPLYIGVLDWFQKAQYTEELKEAVVLLAFLLKHEVSCCVGFGYNAYIRLQQL
ncbi:hypothetical protein F0562_026908 [Nyssa sinensis]|uniref:Protein kinase domain-containing protein n=1 Tax=Nyssa sinensis TaxID=561372 RepID=A0A5J5B286_9ASTE|nr:hypothetical protein F0562_026908 [Nyssa sinensis]